MRRRWTVALSGLMAAAALLELGIFHLAQHTLEPGTFVLLAGGGVLGYEGVNRWIRGLLKTQRISRYVCLQSAV